MKKNLKIVLLLFLVITILGCERKEIPLIELNTYEILDVIENENTFIFAIINDNDTNSKNLLKSLKSYQSVTHNWVYYVNSTNITVYEEELLNILINDDPTESKIFIVNNNDIKESIPGNISYQELREKLGKDNYKEINISKYIENRKNNFSSGINDLNNGNIGSSYAKLYISLPLEDAKKSLENEKIFNLLNSWEYYNENGNNCEYISLQFVKGLDNFFEKKYSGKCSNLKKDDLKTTKYDFYMQNNKILVKEENEKDYKEKYILNNITEETLSISFDNKIYNFKIVK